MVIFGKQLLIDVSNLHRVLGLQNINLGSLTHNAGLTIAFILHKDNQHRTSGHTGDIGDIGASVARAASQNTGSSNSQSSDTCALQELTTRDIRHNNQPHNLFACPDHFFVEPAFSI